MKKALLILSTLLLAAATFSQDKKDSKSLPKLSVDQIVSKHLASIGTPDALAAAKSRVFVGLSKITSKLGYIGQVEGPVQAASTGDKFLLAMVFNSNSYPYEKVAYDGKDLSIGRPNGQNTNLGDFLKSNKFIVKNGLFGGVLSSAWPLLQKDRGLKLEYAGTATLSSGRSVYKLKVVGGGMDTLSVVLFFDADTFRHISTVYTYTVPVRISRAANNQVPDTQPANVNSGAANAMPTKVTLTEQFSNFAKTGDLVMPLTYVLDYNYQDSSNNISMTWDVNIKQAYFDQDLADDVFKVS